ncbi:MAG: hypothetical protein F4Y02_10770 [Chloroflexi bacterium]|nr:hypothetical protein [Chloroflexota bacterium]
MNPAQIRSLRRALRLNQAEFGQLLGAHPVTVSRWETPRSRYTPSAYQCALMRDFEKAAGAQEMDQTLKNLLVGAGIAAAIYFLLNAARGG